MFEYDGDYSGLHERVRQMLDEAKTLSNRPAFSGPFVYGFTMKFTGQGRPVVSEFGNVSPYGIVGFMEPVTDVIEKYDSVSVIVELPGVIRDDIDLRASVESLYIKVDMPFRKYSKDVRFSCRIRPDTTTAKYNNGVLEITIQRVDVTPPGKRISIQ